MENPMGNVFEAKDVHEAVLLAERFKLEGRYNWFRGQTQDWPLKSSLVRLDSKGRDEALSKSNRFEGWVNSTPGLESICTNTDNMLAIAQHYGIPTNFIDFTLEPKIAGFFASEKAPSDPEMYSCILCLDTNDLMLFQSVFTRLGNPPPEFLELDVPNLWRLEAQFGIFLFCPYTNFEHIYDLDRIIFPYTGSVSSPVHDEIYPKRKSSLEILLDQFFMNEKLIKGTNWIRNNINASIMTIEDKEERWSHDIVAKEPSVLDSWSSNLLKPWLVTPREKIESASTDIKITINVDINKSPSMNFSDVYQQVKQNIDGLPNPTDKLINWQIQADSIDQNYMDFLELSTKRTWDGLRILPYDINDIMIGISNCVVLGTMWRTVKKTDNNYGWLECANFRFGKSIEVEFGADDGSYSRGYASQRSLLSSVRDDFLSLVALKYQNQLVENITGTFQAVQSPNRLFEFKKLTKVFAHELVPTQVLIRGDHAIYFSPARLTAFGLP
jgi:hypothetical protein